MTTPAPLFRSPRSSKAWLRPGVLALLVVIGCASGDRGRDLDPVYFALGALSEYVGYRADPSDPRIDTFDAGREAEALVFARYLERAADAEGLDTAIEVRPGAGGCTIVSSGPMKALLVSHYPVRAPAIDAPPGDPAIDLRHTSREMLPDRRAETSWLAGVHLRFAVGDTLVFANAFHKARLAAALLIERGGREVQVTQTPRGHYPTVFTVSYRPSPEIAALFAAVDGEVEAARRGDAARAEFEPHLR